jgi:hypothetical protein
VNRTVELTMRSAVPERDAAVFNSSDAAYFDVGVATGDGNVSRGVRATREVAASADRVVDLVADPF